MIDFYENIYNATPAHSDEINKAIIENDDIQVLTATGGARRTARNIAPTDVIQLKRQRSMFPLFGLTLPRGEGEQG